ncbi:hypothetical protein F5146DRAFT_1154854 [Armillaria mellea]|nr:hypothetical protein F5146DRAFT_1154854 [Armillaria mellea]
MPTKVCSLLLVCASLTVLQSPSMPLLESPISLVSTRPVPRSRLLTRRRGSHPFDSLPWIDILDSPPDKSNLGDLSQLGPVRRHRKARASPLSRPRRLPSSSPSPPPPSPPPPSLPPALLERCSTPPPPAPRPSYVIFHDLMPQL